MTSAPTTHRSSSPHVVMLATEFVLNRVGGLGAHIRGLAPALSNSVPLELVLPCFDPVWPHTGRLGRRGRVVRVDAERPRPGPDYVQEVWTMNDRLSDYIVDKLKHGDHITLVHAHDWLVGFTANLLAREHGLPVVATIHATESGRVRDQINTVDLSKRIHVAEVHLARNADLVITTSEFMRQELIHNLSTPASKIVVIPNGIDARQFRSLRRQRQALAGFRRHYAEPDEALVLYVGRLVWEKGADVLVDAISHLRASTPRVRAVIAGTGPLRAELVERIDQLGLREYVHLAGFIDDELRDKLYAVADIAVFPSRYEPFGIVALEAMAVGVPVIVGDAGGLAEVVDDGVTGLLCAPGDAEHLAGCIQETLAGKVEAAQRVQRGRMVVENLYSWERVAQQTASAYALVLKGR